MAQLDDPHKLWSEVKPKCIIMNRRWDKLQYSHKVKKPRVLLYLSMSGFVSMHKVAQLDLEENSDRRVDCPIRFGITTITTS